jgi:hypothetical protein
MGFTMNPAQLARGAKDEAAARVACAASRRVDPVAKNGTLEGLHEQLKELIPPRLHGLCAHVLVSSGAVKLSGSASDERIFAISDDYARSKANDRAPKTMDEALAMMNALHQARKM